MEGVPKKVEEALKRGRSRAHELTAGRNVALDFWRGNQYGYVDEKNIMQHLSTVTTVRGTGKKPWRARTTRNMILDVVQHEVSSSTQRIPSYEIVPSSTDPQDIGAARLAERVALFGYEKWGLRNAAVLAVTFAVVADEAFAWPYWDSSVGPYIKDGESYVGEGEVKVRIYGPNEVFWEPGVRFEDSAWHAIEHARPLSSLESEYPGKKFEANADTSKQAGKGKGSANQTKQVMVTEYLQRPTAQSQKGKWLCIANDKLLADKGRYPGGEEIVLHKLSYITDPDSDRDMGLVKHLLDAQRTYTDAVNKSIEWKNFALLPQIFVSPGLLRKQRITDQPNAVYEVPQPDQNIKFREVPSMPRELFEIADRAQADISRIAAQNDIPSQVEAGRAIQALIERDATRRQEFLSNLAGWHSGIMRACLQLVSDHYTEDRLLTFRGRFGWEQIRDFQGAKLKDQTDVRVFPGSIEPRTRAGMEARVLAFADRQWISPQAAMAAINGGYAEDLARSYELDVARANLVIQKIKDGPEVLFGQPPRVVGVEPVTDPMGMPVIDPSTGQPATRPVQEPAWMPRQFDNPQVQKAVLADWMKTPDFDALEAGMQTAAMEYYNALEQLEAQKAAQMQQQQMAAAQGIGLSNATRPPSVNGQPDQPAPPNGNAAPTANQPPDQSVPGSPF